MGAKNNGFGMLVKIPEGKRLLDVDERIILKFK
jgi:hypothetical protein